MTVSTSTNSVVYRGNGATTAFAVPFKVLDEDHLAVTRRVYATGAVDYTYVGTDFSFVGVGDDSGTLTLAGAALDDDYELIIQRIVPYTQDLDIVNAGGFYPETVETQLDQMTMGIQQIAEVAGRSIRGAVGESALVLPAPAGRVNRVLGFNATGDEIVMLNGGGEDSDLRSDLADSTVGAALVAVKADRTASVARVLSDKIGERTSVLDFHALAGTGNSTYDTLAMNRAITAMTDGSELWVPPETSLILNQVDVSGKRIDLIAHGATITGAGSAAFTKSDHGKRFAMFGGLYLGTQALRYDATAQQTQYDDFLIAFARFYTSDYALWLSGAREGRIVDCDFEGDWNGTSATNKSGIYRTLTANTDVIASNFKNCTKAIFDDGDTGTGTGSPNSAGLLVKGGTMLGCGHGVHSRLTDFVSLIGLMCDYNDNPVVFEAVDGGEIIGGALTTRTVNAALQIIKNGATGCIGLDIAPGLIASHWDGSANSDCAVIIGAQKVRFHPLKVEGFRRYGLSFKDCVYLLATNTFYSQTTGSPAHAGPRCIFEQGGSASSNTNRITLNEFSTPSGLTAIEVGGNTAIAANTGYTTQSHVTGTITTGNQTVNIAHGCHYTPGVDDCIAYARNDEAAIEGVYVSAVDATNVTVRLGTGVAASDALVGVKVRKREVTL